MASLHIMKSNLSSFSVSEFNFRRKLCCYSSKFKSEFAGKKIRGFHSHSKLRFSISCKLQEGDNQSNGEEPPESLFMKELKRRGMTPTSLLEESNRGTYGDEEMKFKEEEGGFSKRNVLSTDVERSLANQRERSIALNSEGLEGLIPRAKLLLTVGGTFFLGFWPLILITVTFFSALYFYFGPSFIHNTSNTPIAPPQYVDPYALLEEERISQAAPRLN